MIQVKAFQSEGQQGQHVGAVLAFDEFIGQFRVDAKILARLGGALRRPLNHVFQVGGGHGLEVEKGRLDLRKSQVGLEQRVTFGANGHDGQGARNRNGARLRRGGRQEMGQQP